MKFLVAVLMIHFIMALIEEKIKNRNITTAGPGEPNEPVQHPAEFLLR